jgi:hypothetical protein
MHDYSETGIPMPRPSGPDVVLFQSQLATAKDCLTSGQTETWLVRAILLFIILLLSLLHCCTIFRFRESGLESAAEMQLSHLRLDNHDG